MLRLRDDSRGRGLCYASGISGALFFMSSSGQAELVTGDLLEVMVLNAERDSGYFACAKFRNDDGGIFSGMTVAEVSLPE